MDTAFAKTESAMYTSVLDDCIIEFCLHTLQHKYQVSFDIQVLDHDDLYSGYSREGESET